MTKLISFKDIDTQITWAEIMVAIEEGHQKERAQVNDVFIQSNGKTLLNRSAWIEGLGIAVKAATVVPTATPSINGGVMVFEDQTGTLLAVLDFHLVTKWKTLGDSIFAAEKLARKNSKKLLIIGAGTVAGYAMDAYRSIFPNIEVTYWNRNPERAENLTKEKNAQHTTNLAKAVQNSDIICTTTMAIEPILKGEWISPGTHIDLIGAYRADMREADDDLIAMGSIFVDSRGTTIEHIGELKIPIANGIISPDDIVADYYDIESGIYKRSSDSEITIFKNGGGAHLDLMVCHKIIQLSEEA